jgi:hypothetical protein
MFVAAQFTGLEGKYVKIEDTIRGFKEIVDGKHDDVPEQAFLHGWHDRRSTGKGGENGGDRIVFQPREPELKCYLKLSNCK